MLVVYAPQRRYHELCLKLARERRVMVGAGAGWPTLQATLHVESARDILQRTHLAHISRAEEVEQAPDLAPEFTQVAVLDRFACYLPGWEMSKTSSDLRGRGIPPPVRTQQPLRRGQPAHPPAPPDPELRALL
ncbi:MAG TPA: hypothetical protein VL334_15775 [Anaerolineae bacterium]|nr:hypothetical protein [Anaerolineae bacterium]